MTTQEHTNQEDDAEEAREQKRRMGYYAMEAT